MGLHIEIDGVPAYRLIENGPDIKIEPAYGRVDVGGVFVTGRAVYRCISLLHDGQPRWARESPEYQWHRVAKAFVRWVESDLLPRRTRESRLRVAAETLLDTMREHSYLGDAEVQEAASELRGLLYSGEEEDDHALAN